jgi:hypothetical protein
MICHAPRMVDASVTLCGSLLYATTDRGQMLVGRLVGNGEVINCPACRSIVNHVADNFTSKYRYVIVERK